MAIDMDLLGNQLSSLDGEAKHIAHLLRNPCSECSAESITGLGIDELSKFITNVKHATTQLRHFSQRWNSATIIKTEDVIHLEQREAKICKEEASLKAARIELGKEEEILKASAADITKKEELLEQRTRERAAEMDERASKLDAMETQITTKTMQLDSREALMHADLKLYDANQANMTKEEAHLATREVQIRRREEDITRARDELGRHQQVVMQLHQITIEKLDAMREEHAEDKREQQSMINYTITMRQKLKADATKAEASIKRLLKLKSSILTPIQRCEASLANIKQRAQSVNLDELEHQMLSLKGEMALLSSQTDRQTATMSNIHEDIERADHHAGIMDHQFKKISAKLANISDISTGLDANMSEVFTGLNVNISELCTGLNTKLSKVSTGLNANISEVCTGLNANISKVSTGLNDISKASTGLDANISELCSGLNTNISRVSIGLNANISKASTDLNTLSTRFQDMRVTESNATEELRKATVTGSKAREALQKILVRSNATLFNDSTTKRGLGLGQSSPEKPHPKRRRSRHSRAGSAGAAEVLANVEAPELLTKTIQTFGSPRRRIVPPFNAPRTISGGFEQLAPFAGHLSASHSGPSSSAVNPISSSPSTFISSSQSGGSSDLADAHIHVRDVWRQVEFPADWTEADSAKLLAMFKKAKDQAGGKNNRYWPQQAMDIGSRSSNPFCLWNYFRKASMRARDDGLHCETHAMDTLCIAVFYVSDDPGEYDSAGTEKRWRIEKR